MMSEIPICKAELSDLLVQLRLGQFRELTEVSNESASKS